MCTNAWTRHPPPTSQRECFMRSIHPHISQLFSKYAQGNLCCVSVPCLARVCMSRRASSSDRCLGPRQLCVGNPVGNPAVWGGGDLWPTRWRDENCVPSGGSSHSQGEGYQWRRLERLSTAPRWVRRHGPPGSLERALQQRWKKRGANVVFTWVFSWNVWDELHGFLPGREIFKQDDGQCISNLGVSLYKRYLPSGLLLHWSRRSRNCLPCWEVQQPNGANDVVDVSKLLIRHCSLVSRVHKSQ